MCGKKDEVIGLSIYYGPNQYKILNNIHLEEGDDTTEKMIPLGWGIFGWINRFAIIPIFNWLGGFISNYGLLILLMTIIIKIALFPLTYKSYKSSAKMRVLKPQIDEINKKIPKDKAMERQQATMALYRKAGVNPMGGCLPMLIQFPFLIAMYRFFPASIELRQKAFLWTDDLSSYDSILDLPFNIPMYGDHISLFTLLMAVSIVLSTKINGAQMQTGSSQMPGMKMMMWMMPVMMLLWFNNYSSGLSYYYFLSNIITIGQTLLIRQFVDDEAVLQKLNENKKKPKKKSKFQERLEQAAKQRQQIATKKINRKPLEAAFFVFMIRNYQGNLNKNVPINLSFAIRPKDLESFKSLRLSFARNT
ncbi:MAG: membrane protein insertase YidC [Chloroflexia bacterium]|nr:membrane protein insertase YidC [Chloroflexia bacterium]